MNYLIKIDLYSGAYGPTVRIDISSWRALLLFKEILEKLASGRELGCKLEEFPYVEITGFQALHLKVVSEYKHKTVEIVKEGDKTIIYWTNSLLGWSECVGLIEGFTKEFPSHQYLSEEGIDDALIELSYIESKNNVAP